MVPDDYNKSPYESSVRVLLWENRENENYPLHWHTATEIIMPLEYDYEVVLGDKPCRLRENDIFICPSRELHKINVPRGAENGRRIILLFEPVLLYSLPGLSGVISHLHNINLITPENMPEIYHIARSTLLDSYRENRKRDTFKNVAIYAKILELYVALARYYANKKDLFADIQVSKRQDYIARLNQVFDFIDRHLSDEMTLDSAANAANFSKFHFSRIFKEYTGLSFHQYLQSQRTSDAERLLLNPEMTINEVAFKTGFSSITTFNRVFKEAKKCTPSEYKKLHVRGI